MPSSTADSRIPEIGLAGLALLLNAWHLERNGLSNAFYAAAVRSMTTSWTAFFYGSLDPGNWITTGPNGGPPRLVPGTPNGTTPATDRAIGQSDRKAPPPVRDDRRRIRRASSGRRGQHHGCSGDGLRAGFRHDMGRERKQQSV
jgi:hypothetical protein